MISLAKAHPELVQEWSCRNGDLTPNDISYGSNKVVWWKGSCGHEWRSSVKSRSSGEKCPICSGARVIEGINDLATTEPSIALEWSKKNRIKPTQITRGSNKKVIWLGKCGHEWNATVKSRAVNGSGCPICSGNKVVAGINDLKSNFPNIAIEWSAKNYPLKPTDVTPYSNKKVWWKCRKCGNEWKTLISTRSYGSKCPYCTGKVLLKGFNDFKSKYPLIAAEWSEKNLPLTPDMINEKSCRNVWWKCPRCGYEWKGVVKARVKGRECPICSNHKVLKDFNDLATTDENILYLWDYEKNQDVDPTMVTRNSKQKVWWKCKNGHSWKESIVDRVYLNRKCNQCEQEYRMSFPYLIIGYYMHKAGLKTISNSDEIIGIPLDIYVPEERVAINVDIQTDDTEIIKQHICNKNSIKLVTLVFKESESEETYALRVLQLLRSIHIFIKANVDDDLRMIRALYESVREGN